MGTQPAITGLSHVGITVRNLKQSIDFYNDLGFELFKTWVKDEPYIRTLVGYPTVEIHASFLRHPSIPCILELLEYRSIDQEPIDPNNGNPGTVHVCFYVNDLNSLWRRLKSRGINAVSEPVTPTNGPNEGGKAIYAIDPDGVRIELVQTSHGLDGTSLIVSAETGETAP